MTAPLLGSLGLLAETVVAVLVAVVAEAVDETVGLVVARLPRALADRQDLGAAQVLVDSVVARLAAPPEGNVRRTPAVSTGGLASAAGRIVASSTGSVLPPGGLHRVRPLVQTLQTGRMRFVNFG